MLALLVNLALAASAGLMFHLLHMLRSSQNGGGGSALQRAALVVLPPVGFVYAVVVVFSNASVWIQFAILLPVLAAVFTSLLVLRDPSINPSDRERQFLLWTTTAVAIIASSLGLVTILLIYVSPDIPRVLPDHNLLRSWELDFVDLGYTREEGPRSVEPGIHVARDVGLCLHVLCSGREPHRGDIPAGRW